MKLRWLFAPKTIRDCTIKIRQKSNIANVGCFLPICIHRKQTLMFLTTSTLSCPPGCCLSVESYKFPNLQLRFSIKVRWFGDS